MSGWARALSLAAVLVVMACLVPAATASLHAEGTLASQFAEFKQKHGRVYGSAAEEAFRLSVFRANLFLARLHAAANPHATFGVTPFSDLTREGAQPPWGACRPSWASISGIPWNGRARGGAPRGGKPAPTTNGTDSARRVGDYERHPAGVLRCTGAGEGDVRHRSVVRSGLPSVPLHAGFAHYRSCENRCGNTERRPNGGCRVGREAAAPLRHSAVVLCGPVPPPSATHSAPPENHMTPRPALR
ncbi:putative cysteine peptidase [Trypanosoma cruzi]|uniref:Cruzipain, putative n=2 Tax=Trypanosoma cruzi TaxID=5693 RepID=Q4E2M5_TRYCC|nr:cruzipain precursor, putative [Trypanosoma cruzi]EAN99045.1 cruzipain precursor, putative [Trypanosoma cruzi]PWV12555.1 putative cysteine peptidase [Trypanosoma cruzi]|eukprot:XP_820896.1 cruzipain precursor [Trypanosoma cruzi strain CL Brener]